MRSTLTRGDAVMPVAGLGNQAQDIATVQMDRKCLARKNNDNIV